MRTRRTFPLAILAAAIAHGTAPAASEGHERDGTAQAARQPAGATHKAIGVVKKADPQAGSVTLVHEPVKSLNWPSMTMAFKVKDPALFEKLAAERRIEFEFVQEGNAYVLTGVR
jgi:Cu(I)/Ag(I) efflux system protein CusF